MPSWNCSTTRIGGPERLLPRPWGWLAPMQRVPSPSLTALLKDKDWQVRQAAALALGRIGPEAKTVIPSLMEVLHDEYRDVRRAASKAIDKIEKREK